MQGVLARGNTGLAIHQLSLCQALRNAIVTSSLVGGVLALSLSFSPTLVERGSTLVERFNLQPRLLRDLSFNLGHRHSLYRPMLQHELGQSLEAHKPPLIEDFGFRV